MIILKQLRNHMGLSQQALAGKLGVSRSTVAMWETGGAEPDHKALLHLSALLNTTTDEILGNKKVPVLESTQDELSAQDRQLLALFNRLSEQGKGRLLERAEVLAAQTRV